MSLGHGYSSSRKFAGGPLICASSHHLYLPQGEHVPTGTPLTPQIPAFIVEETQNETYQRATAHRVKLSLPPGSPCACAGTGFSRATDYIPAGGRTSSGAVLMDTAAATHSSVECADADGLASQYHATSGPHTLQLRALVPATASIREEDALIEQDNQGGMENLLKRQRAQSHRPPKL